MIWYGGQQRAQTRGPPRRPTIVLRRPPETAAKAGPSASNCSSPERGPKTSAATATAPMIRNGSASSRRLHAGPGNRLHPRDPQIMTGRPSPAGHPPCSRMTPYAPDKSLSCDFGHPGAAASSPSSPLILPRDSGPPGRLGTARQRNATSSDDPYSVMRYQIVQALLLLLVAGWLLSRERLVAWSTRPRAPAAARGYALGNGCRGLPVHGPETGWRLHLDAVGGDA